MLLAAPVAASAARRAIVICLPGLSLEDVTPERMPALTALAQQSGVALLNVVNRASFTGDPRQWDPVASGYLTLGMGGRGWSAPIGADAGLALLPATLDAIREANQGGTRAVQPGWLGTALHQAGLKTAALGCADDARVVRRDILLAAMDAAGRVDTGDVSRRCLHRNPDRPCGLESDADYLVLRAGQLDADLIFIDPGDLQRLERCTPLVPAASAAQQRQAALSQADHLLAGALRGARAAGAMVLVLAPAGHRDPDGKRRTLAPLIWHDPAAPPGMILSGSTRRAGLVALTDLAAALAHRLTGRADGAPDLLRVTPRPDAWRRVRQLNATIERADRWRSPGIRILQVLLFLSWALSGIAARQQWSARARAAVAALPAALFAAACWIMPGGPDLPMALATALGAAAALALHRDRRARLALLYAALAGSIALNLFAGGRTLSDSVLGYSLSLGARYYGLGNEWMGVLTGCVLAAIVLARRPGVDAGQSRASSALREANDGTGGSPARPSSSLREYGDCERSAAGAPGTPAAPGKRWQVASSAALLALVVLFGAPAGGAKFGGTLTALAAAAGFAVLYGPYRGKGAFMAALAAAALLAAAAVAWDALRPAGQQTHVGRLVISLLGGSGDLRSTIAAKLGVNWRITRSFWGLLILLEDGVAWWIAARPLGEKSPDRRRAAALSTITALAAWCFSDAGAIAAALLLAPCPGMLLLVGAETVPDHRDTIRVEP